MPIFLILLFLLPSLSKNQPPARGGLPRAHLLPCKVRHGGFPREERADWRWLSAVSQGHCCPARTRQEASQGQRWRQQHPLRPAQPRDELLPRPLQVASQGHRYPRLPRALRLAASPHSPLWEDEHPSSPHRADPLPLASLATHSRGPPLAKAEEAKAQAGQAGSRGSPAGRGPSRPAAPASSARRTELTPSAPAPLGFPGLPSRVLGARLPLAGSASRHRQRPPPAVPCPRCCGGTWACGAPQRSSLHLHLPPSNPASLRLGTAASILRPTGSLLPSFLGKEPSWLWLPRQPAAVCQREGAPACPDPGKCLSEAVLADERAERSRGTRRQPQRGSRRECCSGKPVLPSCCLPGGE